MAMASPIGFISTEVNVTINCSVTCPTFSFCLYDVCFPPPPLNSSSSDSTPIHFHHPDRLLPNLLISAASLLAFSFLLLLTSYFLLRLRRRRRLREAHQPSSRQNPDDADEGDLFEGGDGTHHVWYIRTVGLDESTIRSIAATVYKAEDGLIDGGGDCAVCLSEFEDGEIIKLLPKCTHAFHLPCIDTWLRSHVGCPLCRAPIVAPVAISATTLDPVDPESTAAPAENAQIEIPPSDQEEIGIEIDTTSGPSSELPADLGENELQPVRRSVSMDSLSLGVLLRVESEKKNELDFQGGVSKNRKKLGNVSKGDSLDKGTGRSLSSSSGRFFFSRHGRAQSSVLPL